MPDGTLQRSDTEEVGIAGTQQTSAEDVLIFDFDESKTKSDDEQKSPQEMVDYMEYCVQENFKEILENTLGDTESCDRSNMIITTAIVHVSNERKDSTNKIIELPETIDHTNKIRTRKAFVKNMSEEDLDRIEVMESGEDTLDILENKEVSKYSESNSLNIDESVSRKKIQNSGKNEKTVTVLQDITLKSLNTSFLSPSFSSHLYFPDPMNKKNKRIKKDRLPAAIFSSEFKNMLQKKKTRRKRLKMKRKSVQILQRKRNRENKIETDETCVSESVMDIKDSFPESVIDSEDKESRIKEKCATCSLDIDSDTEDNDLKNIGCDRCPNWFHLKCSPFQGYHEIEIRENDLVVSNLNIMEDSQDLSMIDNEFTIQKPSVSEELDDDKMDPDYIPDPGSDNECEHNSETDNENDDEPDPQPESIQQDGLERQNTKKYRVRGVNKRIVNKKL
ncbi:unnamed protein product [Phaedon cochleariae]|uniref:PHD-type domain-containing protein n=1 Tax=Phaedon cochleariae TaxID=80249 RepID=A0A9N9SI84_PHACE|nr:unnamed protein product [Phaedon cochleariae]